MSDPSDIKSLIAQWLDVGYPDKRPTGADAWHSALLGRLLEGKQPLPEPPPRAFSYPWYSLIENGSEEGYMDIHVHDGENPWVGICQSTWKLIEQHPDYMIVEWPPTKLRCRLTALDIPDNHKIEVLSEPLTKG